MPQPFPSPSIVSARPDGSLLVQGHERAPLALLWPDPSSPPSPSPPITGIRTPAGEGLTPWMAPARADWASRADRFEAASLGVGSTPALLPHHADVISDTPSILTFLRACPAWALILCPRWLLTPEMESRAEDHLMRIGEALGTHPALRGILLTPDLWHAGTIAAWTPPAIWTARLP
ncbi:MAG: hypothetical protein IT433_13285 [Phycisphaerales bacterium]|nr:hypothetical protein [Phycisphaerales bacterium]